MFCGVGTVITACVRFLYSGVRRYTDVYCKIQEEEGNTNLHKSVLTFEL